MNLIICLKVLFYWLLFFFKYLINITTKLIGMHLRFCSDKTFKLPWQFYLTLACITLKAFPISRETDSYGKTYFSVFSISRMSANSSENIKTCTVKLPKVFLTNKTSKERPLSIQFASCLPITPPHNLACRIRCIPSPVTLQRI